MQGKLVNRKEPKFWCKKSDGLCSSFSPLFCSQASTILLSRDGGLSVHKPVFSVK